MSSRTIHVVLPAFNEADSLPGLLTRFRNLPDDHRSSLSIHVINDGSTDDTRKVARNFDSGIAVEVVEHARNMGLGQAVQTGIRTVLQVATDDDILVLMDADDTHDPGLIKDLTAKIEAGADIVMVYVSCAAFLPPARMEPSSCLLSVAPLADVACST